MRTVVLSIVAVAVVLLVGWLGYTWVFDGSQQAMVVVESVRGTVERSRPQEGSHAVEAGERLAAADRIRVADDSEATLTVGGDARLRLAPKAAIEIVEVTADGVRVELEEGRVEANVRPGAPRLSVTAGDRVAVARDADFAVGVEDGAFAVAVQRGAVEVDGAPLAAGQRLTQAGEGAAQVQPLDAQLLLEVRWPQEPARETSATLRGTTEPGALVVASGGAQPAQVRADPDGAFRLAVPLSEGENALSVSATNALGRTIAVSGAVVTDSQAPAAEHIQVSWGQ